jgi:hypothetical protein
VAQLLNRLATTARSFLLYDPGNETIHRFLWVLMGSLEAVLQDEGSLVLAVEPFALLLDGEAVYLNRDRERSLAYRLYRDGVRTLTFREGFAWRELASLLEILSIRYTGLHQREDDTVTLLWKASFKHIEVVAVEGVVPDEGELSEQSLPSDPVLPEDVDLPAPGLPPPASPAWVEVSEGALGALRQEVGEEALAEDCLTLLDHLRRELANERDPVTFADVAHLFAEVRDFLLSEDHLEPLKRFVAALWEMAAEDAPPWDPDRHARIYDLLDSVGDRRAVRRLLRSVPSEARLLNPQIIGVLDRACPDPLMAVVDALYEEKTLAARATARQLLEHYGARRPEVLEENFKNATASHVASDLMRVIAGIGGAAFVARQASHPDAAVQDEALWHLGHMTYSGAVGRALVDVFRAADAERRRKVLAIMARTRDRRFVEALAGFVEEHGEEVSLEEAALIGHVAGTVGGEESIPVWQNCLQPRTGLRPLHGQASPLGVMAAAALGSLPGDEAAAVLNGALNLADGMVRGALLEAAARKFVVEDAT